MKKEKNVLHIMFILVHYLKKAFTYFLDTYNVTEKEAKIIFFMDKEDIKMSELIEYFKKHKSTITQKTKSLEKKGYIKIIYSKEDKRERLIQLTAKGKGFHKKMKALEIEYHNSVFKKFTQKEKQQLLSLLEKIEIQNYENIC